MKQLLTINPDTFLWLEDKFGLMYDSCSFSSYRFRLTPQISRLCDKFLDPDYLYSADIDMDGIDYELRDFIEHVTEKGIGTLHNDSGNRHIISFPPLLNIQCSWERTKNRGNDAYNEILPYLTSLTFYIGGICPVTDYFRQTTYPVCTERVLPAEKILGFLFDAGSPYITDIRIVFSSVKGYPDLNPLLDGLKTYGDAVKIYVRAEEIVDAESFAMLSSSGFSIVLLHTTSFGIETGLMPTAKHIFLITSMKEYMEVERLCEDKKIEMFEIIPVFNGCNADFFRKNIFLTEEDILSSRLKRRAIFAHMAINTGYFGSLLFMPDGRVYADSASIIPVGCINDSIYTLITTELDCNTAWRRTRDSLARCKKCMYRYLCPSPTAYEKVMGLECICTDIKEKGGNNAGTD